jgi:putative endonuclease
VVKAAVCNPAFCRANPNDAPLKKIMTYCIYILKSLKDNKNYTGYTNNIKRRLNEHQAGGVKSTQNRRPLKLIHKEEFSTKQEAMKREKFLKSRTGRREIKKITTQPLNIDN